MSNQEKLNQTEMFLKNPAELTGEALVEPCVNCSETIYFALQDNERTFSIGLQTVLQCLRFAEEQGEVPKLPQEWWHAIIHKYRL